MNKILLVGRIAKDAEMRYTADGKPVSNFNFAVDDGWGDKKTTIWFKCAVWGKRAEALNEYLTKGTRATIVGRLSHDEGNPRTWTGSDGVTHASFEINVDDIKLQGSKKTQEEIPF